MESYNWKLVIQKPVTLGSGARAILFFPQRDRVLSRKKREL
jgi:hypothetical protein